MTLILSTPVVVCFSIHSFLIRSPSRMSTSLIRILPSSTFLFVSLYFLFFSLYGFWGTDLEYFDRGKHFLKLYGPVINGINTIYYETSEKKKTQKQQQQVSCYKKYLYLIAIFFF